MTFDMSTGNGTVDLGTIQVEKISWQVDATGLDAADAVVTIQESNTGVNYIDLADNLGNKLEVTLDASPTVTKVLKTTIGMSKKFRASIVVNTVTTGTLTFTASATQ